MGDIRIGTSGFSYDDWMGAFYPPSLKPNHRLEYYAGKFQTVELNSSFYQLPALPAVYGMLNKAVCLNETLTRLSPYYEYPAKSCAPILSPSVLTGMVDRLLTTAVPSPKRRSPRSLSE